MSKTGSSTGLADKSETRDSTQRPPLYKVVFHNDDFTSMEFVVTLLVAEFHHPESVAFRIMMDVHRKGHGIAGVYTKEIAETKAAKAVAAARREEFPLEVTIEPE